MSNKSLKTAFLQALSEDLSLHGFMLRKSENEFFQKCEVGENRFEIIFYTKYLLTITCATAIRCPIMQDFLCDTLNAPAYIKRYHTFHTKMEDHPDFACDYKFRLGTEDGLGMEDKIPEIKQHLIKYFRDVSLPFYKRYDSLEKIYRLYTEYRTPQDKWIRQSPDWSCDAIIIAKVLNKKEYPQLVVKYREFLKTYAAGIYLPTYEKIVTALEHYPLKGAQ